MTHQNPDALIPKRADDANSLMQRSVMKYAILYEGFDAYVIREELGLIEKRSWWVKLFRFEPSISVEDRYAIVAQMNREK